MIEEIKSKITEAFEHFRDEDGIEMKNIRVKIEKQNGKLKFYLLDKTKVLRDTNLKEMLGFTTALMVQLPLYNAVKRTLETNGLDENNAHIRLFPLPDNSPSTFIFNDGKALKQVEIEELLN